jgi:hypothetical protein
MIGIQHPRFALSSTCYRNKCGPNISLRSGYTNEIRCCPQESVGALDLPQMPGYSVEVTAFVHDNPFCSENRCGDLV